MAPMCTVLGRPCRRDDLLGDRASGRERDREAAVVCVVPVGDARDRAGGDDADHLAVGVDQRTAGVAGLDRRVGLDQAGELFRRAVGGVLRGDGLVEAGDLPATAIGAPPSPPALPIAMTESPTLTVEESPSGAGVSPRRCAA